MGDNDAVSEATTPVISTYVGRNHVMVAVNDAWRARFGEPPLGLPLTEAYPDPVWNGLRRLMTRVYDTGHEVDFPWVDGEGVIVPVTVSGRRGVSVAYAPDSLRMHEPAPRDQADPIPAAAAPSGRS